MGQDVPDAWKVFTLTVSLPETGVMVEFEKDRREFGVIIVT
jgi:hypothetical protein